MKNTKNKPQFKRKKLVKNVMIGIAIVICIIIANLIYDVVIQSMQSKKLEKLNQMEEDENVELKLVYAYQNRQWNSAVEQSVARFEDKYPNIKISYEIQYENKVYDDVLNKLNARKELGDIVQLKAPFFYAEADILAEMPESVSSLVKNDYVYDDKVYGVCAVATTTGVLYNKNMYKAYGLDEPQNYEEFLHICEVLKRNNITPLLVGGADLWHMEFLLNHFTQVDILRENQNWFDECRNNKTSWTDAQPRKMIERLKTLFDCGYVNADWEIIEDSATIYQLIQGKTAMCYTGSWKTKELEEMGVEDKFGWYYLPDDIGDTIVTDTQDAYWCMTKECAASEKKYEAASKFLQFFYSEENYELVLTQLNGLSMTECDIDVKTSDIYEIIKKGYSENTKMTEYIGNEDTPQTFERSMLQKIGGLLRGESDVEQTSVELDRLWNLHGTEERNEEDK